MVPWKQSTVCQFFHNDVFWMVQRTDFVKEPEKTFTALFLSRSTGAGQTRLPGRSRRSTSQSSRETDDPLSDERKGRRSPRKMYWKPCHYHYNSGFKEEKQVVKGRKENLFMASVRDEKQVHSGYRIVKRPACFGSCGPPMLGVCFKPFLHSRSDYSCYKVSEVTFQHVSDPETG